MEVFLFMGGHCVYIISRRGAENAKVYPVEKNKQDLAREIRRMEKIGDRR
jgi:uncharacterized protein (DUF2126 family)